MRKIILSIICSIFLCLPNYVFANVISCNNNQYSASIQIDKEKLSINETTNIKIDSDTEYEVNYKYSINDVIKIEDGIIKAINEGVVQVNADLSFMGNSFSISTCKFSFNIEVVSADSTLKKLQIEGMEKLIDFKPEKYDYFVTVPHNTQKISLLAETTSSTAKVAGLGRVYLEDGVNDYKIIVTASDGSQSTYKLSVIRELASGDNDLKELFVEGYIISPSFDKDIHKYSLDVDKDVEEIIINAAPNNEFATVTGTGKHKLASGNNTFVIKVVAENNDEETYEVNVKKSAGLSKLRSLSIDDVQFSEDKFDSEIYVYHVTINNNIDSLNINAISESDNDEITIIGNQELQEGENNIFVKVSNKDKSTTTYKIIVNKLTAKEQKEIEKNSKLLNMLLILFIGSIIVMISLIAIFLKRNYKRKVKRIKTKK